MEKLYRDLVWQSKKRESRITITWNLCDIHTKESGKSSKKYSDLKNNMIQFLVCRYKTLIFYCLKYKVNTELWKHAVRNSEKTIFIEEQDASGF